MRVLKIAATICLLGVCQNAYATPVAPTTLAPVYDFKSDGTDFKGHDVAGDLTYLHTQYTPGNNFYWNFTLEDVAQGEKADGFYLVVNNGPNPKMSTNELAIIYGDLESNTLSVFAYDTNSGTDTKFHSYKDQTGHIATIENAFSVVDTQTTRQVQFGLDTEAINTADFGADWQGILFDENIGFWFHPVLNSTFSYNADGMLSGFNRGTTGWYDTNFLGTTIVTCDEAVNGCGGGGSEVPEPATVGLLLIGLGGLAAKRRKRKQLNLNFKSINK